MWFDAIIIAIFLFFLWRGYEKGFLNNFVYLIGWVVSIGAAWYLWQPVKNFLESNLELATDFTKMVEGKILDIVILQEAAGEATNAAKASGLLGIPQKMMAFIQTSIADAGIASAEVIAEVTADVCLSILAFLVVVLLAKIVTNFVIKLFDGVGKVPVIGTVNNLFGAVMGALKGIVIIILVLMLMVPIFTVTDNKMLLKAYDNARLTPYLYEHNPIFLFWKG